ncbi:MAG: glycosyltransferase family 2 protein [Chloroflexota bacterium]|jgi:N-acetylglucosaminyl-diphospho-decaprenol L-rhamnosyltransferase
MLGDFSLAEPTKPLRAALDATPKLSVVIVNYNTRDLLQACLRSIEKSEEVPSMELFVVDNASSDGSLDMVSEQFPWVRLIACEENRGYAYANNLALRQCRGEYWLLLNPDTVLPPRALREMTEYMDSHPEAGVAGPKLVRQNGCLDLACRRGFPSPEVSFYRMLGLSKLFPKSRRFGRYNMTYLDPDQPAEVDSVVGAFMMVRAAAAKQVGLLDESFFMYGEDLDWAFRIKSVGWKVLYNPAVVVLHYKGASSRHSRKATIEFYRAMDIFYKKHYAKNTNFVIGCLIVAAIRIKCLFSLTVNRLRPT